MTYTVLPEERKGNWLQTYTGRAFYPLDPRPEDICILDIAHALSNICRYGGHCLEYFSVASHSILVSKLVPDGMKMWGLLHDASEAYLVDIPRPIKEHLPDYRMLEQKCQRVIATVFNLSLPIPDEVKHIDNMVLKLEREKLMIKSNKCMWFIDDLELDIPLNKKSYREIELHPLDPKAAEKCFLERYEEILIANNERY